MERAEQLKRWVGGDPVHDDERDECTPDFACCQGKEHLAPKVDRLKFSAAVDAGDSETYNAMIGMFLTRLLSAEFGDDANTIHVAGFEYDAPPPGGTEAGDE